MIQRITILAVFMFATIVVKAQSGEIQAYIQQIAALEVYIKDAEKGYGIVESGVHTIGSIKNGTFNLHSVFFNSLKAISPSVSSYAEIAEIIALQISIVELFQSTISHLQSAGQLHAGEMAYLGQVYNSVVNAGIQDIQALTNLITAGDYSMNDGERLRQIDALYADMSDKYTFSQAFAGQCQALDRSRSREAIDISEVSNLYGK